MVYVNEIYSGNVILSDENKQAINAYVNVIKENASFLNGNRGMVKNQLNMASNLINSQTNDNIVNYYIIKSGEALEIRSNKIDSTISAIDSIISILESNLTPSSCYYQNSLTSSYESMLSSLNNTTTSNENTQLAKNIAESINMLDTNNSSTTQSNTNSSTSQSNTNTTQVIDNTRRINNSLNTNSSNNTTNNTLRQHTHTNTTANNNNQRNNTSIDTQRNLTTNTQRNTTAIDTQRNNQSINTNYDNQVQTLEEYKNNTVEQQTTNNESGDFSRQTPSQRARTRRTQNNTNNTYNPTMNPGSLNKTITNENENQITKRRESNRISSDTENTAKHKATRVPYRMQSTYDD